MLQDCHARIRHFTQLSRTLAEARAASQTQVAEAAEAIFRYFKYALPLHEADENETLYPRLHDVAPLGTPLRDAARAMVEQHQSDLRTDAKRWRLSRVARAARQAARSRSR